MEAWERLVVKVRARPLARTSDLPRGYIGTVRRALFEALRCCAMDDPKPAEASLRLLLTQRGDLQSSSFVDHESSPLTVCASAWLPHLDFPQANSSVAVQVEVTFPEPSAKGAGN